jgi:hypothetical protein
VEHGSLGGVDEVGRNTTGVHLNITIDTTQQADSPRLDAYYNHGVL